MKLLLEMMTVSDHTRAMWRVRLRSAFRTTLACAMVWTMTIYGPTILRKEIVYRAFAFSTTILIVTDATLGDTIRGCWHALFATFQVIPLSILTLWLVGPNKFSPWVAAVFAAVGAFLVALPQCTHHLCKKIAFGQIVLVTVGTIVHGEHTEVVMHPARIALSTNVGSFAAVLALSLPYPRLGYLEVQNMYRHYAKNVFQRINLYVEAFSAHDKAEFLDKICQVNPLAETGGKLLQSIKTIQNAVSWERPHLRDVQSNLIKSGDRLKGIEIAMRGMEMALSSSSFFPVNHLDENLKRLLGQEEAQMWKTLDPTNIFVPSSGATPPGTNEGFFDKLIASYQKTDCENENLASLFFLSCVKLFQQYLISTQRPNKEKPTRFCYERPFKISSLRPKTKTLIFAMKCSVSLGLAVFFGLFYSTKQGYWAGLIISFSFSKEREGTFTNANARTQGTALGSIYGVLSYFLLEKVHVPKVVALPPWILIASFLMHSRMYNQTGGISAIIAALLVLGRNNYGDPPEFALTRLMEVFIGLFCLLVVELLLQPTGAATLAKVKLLQSLGTLKVSISKTNISRDRKDVPFVTPKMGENQERVEACAEKLKMMIMDAELEPDFWFVPFRAQCYRNLLHTISKINDIMLIMQYNMDLLVISLGKSKFDRTELHKRIDSDLQQFKNNLGSKLDYLEKVAMTKPVAKTKRETNSDVHNEHAIRELDIGNECKIQIDKELDGEKIASSFAKYLSVEEGEKSSVNEMAMCLGALGFCICSLTDEMITIEKGIYELVRWENQRS